VRVERPLPTGSSSYRRKRWSPSRRTPVPPPCGGPPNQVGAFDEREPVERRPSGEERRDREEELVDEAGSRRARSRAAPREDQTGRLA
jgi:hypothetical protein